MVPAADARKIAMTLQGAADESDDRRLVFSIAGKGFAWTFMRRPAPKAKRVPDVSVLAVRCTMESKHMLIAAAPNIYFDDDHYRNFPAVLVRLKAIGKKEFTALLEKAWELQKPKPRASRAKRAERK